MSSESEIDENEFHVPKIKEYDQSDNDSDKELQVAFQSGLLKPGLYGAVVVDKKPDPINNVRGMLEKLEELQQKDLDWIERLDVTVERKEKNDPTLDSTLLENERKHSLTTSVHNDFKRELSFISQAQAAVLEVLPKLKQAGIYTKRPQDYFAEMAKKDDHMKKIRENLLSLQKRREHNEKFRKQLRLKKHGKKIQKAIEMERSKQKKDTLDSIKKIRKGKEKNTDFLENKKEKQMGRTAEQSRKKRIQRDKKFGFGGKKRGIKRNDAESVNNVSRFKSGKNPKKNARVGKSRRQTMKNKNKK